MKVYTKTGDKGTTSLVGGKRVAKDSARLEAYGTVDELNSWIGLLAAEAAEGEMFSKDIETLTRIQHRLFDVGSELATEPESKWQPTPLSDTPARELEAEIDRLEETLPHHNRFILPGGSPLAAKAHIARTVCRRTERRVVSLAASVDVNPNIIGFLNRLSDYLFVLSRHFCLAAGAPEIFLEKID